MKMKKYAILVLIGMLILSYGVGTGLAKPDNAGNANGKKAGVIKAVDNKIEHAEKLVERLSECSDVTGLNETLDDIKEARDDLVDAINESNRTAARMAAKELRTNWVKFKKDAHYNIVMCKSKGIGKVIDKSDRIADKAERLIEKFEDRGVDVTEANGALQDVIGHIDNAQEAYDNKDLKTAIQELKGARDAFKDVIRALRDALREMKEEVAGDEDEEEEAECVNDTDCESGEYCDDGKCKETEEDECVNDTDCGEGEYCDDGKCKETEEDEDEEEEQGAGTIGYWKNHAGALNNTLNMSGGITISNTTNVTSVDDAINILDANADNMSDMLAAQLLAAKLNIASCIDGSCIEGRVAEAYDCLSSGNCSDEHLEELKDDLDDFNEDGC